MIALSMKTYLALLWGISVWFSSGSTSASITETSSMNSTAEPDKTSGQLITPRVAHDEGETHPTHKPAEVSGAATVETTLSPTVETEEAVVADRSDSSNGSTAGLVAMNTVAAMTSGSGPRVLQTSTVADSTAAGEAQPSHSTRISATVKPPEDELHQQSSTTSTDMTAPATTSATISAVSLTVVASSPQSMSTTKPEVTSTLSSTTSSADSSQAPVSTQSLTSPSASTTTTMTANPTSVVDSISLTVAISETSTFSSTELSSTSKPVSVTRTHISTSRPPDPTASSSNTEPPTTSFSTDSATSTTATASTSPAGILIPHVSERLPIPTTESTPATTTAPCKVSKSPTSAEVQPCSTRGMMKHCLIAVAFMAGLATVFMVSTIILCTKLSTRKYKVRKPPPATEMMCISALLPERTHTYTRQRNPLSNGILVIHGGGGDSDEDGGDNVTLSSFLPENDRFV